MLYKRNKSKGFEDDPRDHRRRIEEHCCLELLGMRERLLDEEHRLTLLEDIQERSLAEFRDIEEDRIGPRNIALYYSFISTLCDCIEEQKNRLGTVRREYDDKRADLLRVQLGRVRAETDREGMLIGLRAWPGRRNVGGRKDLEIL